mgnify:CR=1 FL=1
MEANTSNLDYKDLTRIITVIGILLLLVGTVAALLGPVEMYCFYLFSEGGRFHYEGFGFGSFMFGNIAKSSGITSSPCYSFPIERLPIPILGHVSENSLHFVMRDA